jgi:Flp pilus assembly protein TadG
MKQLLRLNKSEDGAAAVEMALALPVLVSMIYGIFQVGLLYQANAGMQHALG